MKVGDRITVSGKQYEIVGTHKRSFLLKGKNGKTYKATEAKLQKMLGSAPADSVPAYLKRRVDFQKLFNPNARLPETEAEIMSAFQELACALSPENISCDGEASAAHIRSTRAEINKAWRYLENKLGRRMSEDDVFGSLQGLQPQSF